MKSIALYQLHIARDYRAVDERSARLAAHAREAHELRAQTGAPAPGRRALGRSLIKLGERIAAEPVLRPVRSR